MLNQFSNLSCYEEFEIQCTLTGISKIDILKEIGHQIDNYYFFISNDGIFNWFDLNGNHIEYPGVLKKIKCEYISRTITKCIIPNGVISIDDYVFADCYSLNEVIIPDSVIYIGRYTFASCYSLNEITIPNSVIRIDDNAFYGCTSLKEVIIPDSIASIGFEAFHWCTALTSVTISRNVKDINFNAFLRCKSLKEVIFKGKTLEEVKQMKNYPFGKYENVFKFS